MEREGTKHGPRIDDELKHETEGLVRGEGPTPAGLTNEDVQLRSELASILQPLELPASRQDVLQCVADADASAAVRARAEQLSDRSYDNLGEIFDDLDLVE